MSDELVFADSAGHTLIDVPAAKAAEAAEAAPEGDGPVPAPAPD